MFFVDFYKMNHPISCKVKPRTLFGSLLKGKRGLDPISRVHGNTGMDILQEWTGMDNGNTGMDLFESMEIPEWTCIYTFNIEFII